MTHLERLAEEFRRMAREAICRSARYQSEQDEVLAYYDGGAAAAWYRAADRLCAEALDREGIDKEVKK